jgi:hypothetical protein
VWTFNSQSRPISRSLFLGSLLPFSFFRSFSGLCVCSVGLAIVPQNLFAYGSGVQTATAGVQAQFYLQTYEYSVNSTGSRVAGAPLTWGNGLSLTVQVLGRSTGTVDTALVQGTVTEIGSGLYSVTYTALRGRVLEVFVSLDGVSLPESPIRVPLAPSQPVGALSAARGSGLQGAVDETKASFTVAGADQYGNALQAGMYNLRLLIYPAQPISPHSFMWHCCRWIRVQHFSVALPTRLFQLASEVFGDGLAGWHIHRGV